MPSFKTVSKAKKGRNTSVTTSQALPRRQPTKRFNFKRVLILLLVILLVILVSIGTTIYLTWPASADLIGLRNTPKSALQPISKVENLNPISSEKPLFFTLEPFTATITDGSRSRIIHVAMTPQVADKNSMKLLEDYRPLVRDRVLRILSEQNPSHVQTSEGRQQLVDSLLSSLSHSYDNGSESSPRILDLFFTAFVIQ